MDKKKTAVEDQAVAADSAEYSRAVVNSSEQVWTFSGGANSLINDSEQQ